MIFREDHNHLINLRNSYRAWWQRLTWKFCDTFKVPSDKEQKVCIICISLVSIKKNITLISNNFFIKNYDKLNMSEEEEIKIKEDN